MNFGFVGEVFDTKLKNNERIIIDICYIYIICNKTKEDIIMDIIVIFSVNKSKRRKNGSG